MAQIKSNNRNNSNKCGRNLRNKQSAENCRHRHRDSRKDEQVYATKKKIVKQRQTINLFCNTGHRTCWGQGANNFVLVGKENLRAKDKSLDKQNPAAAAAGAGAGAGSGAGMVKHFTLFV